MGKSPQSAQLTYLDDTHTTDPHPPAHVPPGGGAHPHSLLSDRVIDEWSFSFSAIGSDPADPPACLLQVLFLEVADLRRGLTDQKHYTHWPTHIPR